MWLFWALSACSFCSSLAFMTNPNSICSDLNPQDNININQILGMWFAIEIISHQPDDNMYTSVLPSCPVIQITDGSQGPDAYTTPLHRDFNYNYNYAPGHDYNFNHRTSQGRAGLYGQYNQYHSSTPGYDMNINRVVGDDNTYYNGRNQFNIQGGSTTFGYGGLSGYSSPRHVYGLGGAQGIAPGLGGMTGLEEGRHLRLWWDENGRSTEYQIQYDRRRPGFWFTKGPDAGFTSLSPQFGGAFDSTIQVLKAVGENLVLNFCIVTPGRNQHYSVLLARENIPDRPAIYGTHELLKLKGLSTRDVRRVCGGGGKASLSAVLALLVMGMQLFKWY